jgi:glycerol uptake operon antiterminator
MIDVEEMLLENPIIAAVRDNEGLEKAINSSLPIVFLLYGSIITVPELCERLKASGKTVFIHLDLIEGLRGDSSAVEYIKRYAAPAGIITTKSTNIRYAKQQGLLTIQRIFVIDSFSLTTGVKGINENGPDAVEVMPGIAGKIIQRLEKKINVPIIAGGLIETKEDIMEALSSGAVAISTTRDGLWTL